MKNNRKKYRVNKIKKENPPKFIILLGVVVLLVIFYLAGCTFVNQIKLKLYGEKKTAVVTKVIKYEGTTSSINYIFEVNGMNIVEKAVPVDEEVAVGDSISIIYLPSDPKVNTLQAPIR